MKSPLLLALLFSLPALAEFDVDCKKVSFEDQLVAAVGGVKCPTSDEQILSAVEAEYKKNFGSLPVTQKVVKGIRLKGSQKELDYAVAMLGDVPPKGWPTAAAQCETVKCAMGKLLGSSEAAMQLMNIKAKTGSTVSLDQEPNKGIPQQIWSPGELREMDAAISKLPPELRSLSSPIIKRVPDGYRINDDSANVAMFARPGIKGFMSAEVVVYDVGMRGLTANASPYETTSWPQEALVHELCHHHDFKGMGIMATSKMISEKKNSEFAALSGWKEVTNSKGQSEWKASPKAKFISGYASSQPAEDYAETCMNYLLHPQKLKEVAPEKYAYMKKNVFNNREFIDQVWVKGKDSNWPELALQVKDQSQCSTKLAECISGQRFNTWNSTAEQIESNECVRKYRQQRSEELVTKLSVDPKFCDYGGEDTIRKGSGKMCAETIAALGAMVDKARNADLSEATGVCEKNLDFTTECILKEANLSLNVPDEMKAHVGSMLAGKIPDRAAAVGNNIARAPTNSWLKACIGTAETIEVYQGVTDKGEKIDISSYEKKGMGSTYMGRFIYDNYDQNDLNRACAKETLKSLSAQGYKIPEVRYPVNVMQKPFLEEFNSFQTEVLKEMSNATKGCFLPKCKSERIFDLLQRWEAQSPERREGFATKEYAEELRAKVKSY